MYDGELNCMGTVRSGTKLVVGSGTGPLYLFRLTFSHGNQKSGRIHEQLRDICAILSGLAVAADYEVGQKMIKDRSFEDNAESFALVFEIVRLNPQCMRADYGKLVHMLMDSQNPDIQRLLEFKLVKKVTTVYDYLKSKDSLLKCPDRGRTRAEVQQAIKCKESAVKRIVRKFSNDDLGEEEIEWCLYSIGRRWHNALQLQRQKNSEAN